jgi:hypothetical protein
MIMGVPEVTTVMRDNSARAINLGYVKAIDVVTTAGKQADHVGEDAGLVVHEHGDGVLLDSAGAAHVGLLRGRPPPRRAALELVGRGPEFANGRLR